MSHYLVLLILEFLPALLATLPYGLDSNVTQLLANLLTKPSVFCYLPIVPCNLVSLKLLLLLLLLLIVDPWQSCVCFIRPVVTRSSLLMALYLDCTCQCLLRAMLWSHIGTLMHGPAAEPGSTAGFLFPSECPSGTILLTPYSMVWDWRVSRAGPMLFYWPKLLYPDYSLLMFFPFSSFCL